MKQSQSCYVTLLSVMFLSSSIFAADRKKDHALEHHAVKLWATKDHRLNRALVAVSQENIKELCSLKNDGFDFKQTDKQGYGFAHYAAVAGAVEALGWLQHHQYPLDGQGKSMKEGIGITPYQLIFRTFEVMEKRKTGCQGYHDSIIHRQMHNDPPTKKKLRSCRAFLKKHNAHLNRVDPYEGKTELHIAAGRGDVQTVKKIMHAGTFEVDVRDFQRQTALHCAAMSGFSNVIELLIKAGADVHARTNKFGRTAAHLVVMRTRSNSGNPMPIYRAKRCLWALINQGGYKLNTTDSGGCGYNYGTGDYWDGPQTIMSSARKNGTTELVEFLQKYQ